MTALEYGINHIYEGDCYGYLRSIPENFVDATVTDPPFGIGFNYSGEVEKTDNPQEYWAWFEPIFKQILRVTKPGGLIAIWQTQLYFKYFWQWFGENIHIYVAAKNFVQIRPTPINYAYDPVVMLYKPGAKPLIPSGKRRSLDYSLGDTTLTKRLGEKHPCSRPLNQVQHVIDNFVVERGLVLEPFAGLASIPIACVNSGRRFIAFEKNPEYVRLSLARLQPYLEQATL